MLKALVVAILAGYGVNAQTFMNDAIDPATKLQQQERDARLDNWVNENANSSARTGTVYIPTVVHIVYHDSVDILQPAFIANAINEVNLDLLKLNNDLSDAPSGFSNIAGSANIQLCLADRDEAGNPTTGIIHQYTPVVYWHYYIFGQDSVKFDSIGGSTAWNTSKYLNIWVAFVNGGIGGYSFYADQHGRPNDGIVIVRGNFNRKTITHEFGHYMNLYHIWGLGSGYTCEGADGGDHVADTPDQTGIIYGCPTFPATDSCSSASPGINIHNFMNYTGCTRMFTQGQTDRMNAALNVYRSSFFTATGCSAISSVAESQKPLTQITMVCREGTLYVCGVKSSCTIQIFDMSGRMILSMEGENNQQAISFPAGIYMYRVFEKTRNNWSSGKFIHY